MYSTLLELRYEIPQQILSFDKTVLAKHNTDCVLTIHREISRLDTNLDSDLQSVRRASNIALWKGCNVSISNR